MPSLWTFIILTAVAPCRATCGLLPLEHRNEKEAGNEACVAVFYIRVHDRTARSTALALWQPWLQRTITTPSWAWRTTPRWPPSGSIIEKRPRFCIQTALRQVCLQHHQDQKSLIQQPQRRTNLSITSLQGYPRRIRRSAILRSAHATTHSDKVPRDRLVQFSFLWHQLLLP